MAGPTQYVTGLVSSISWDQVIDALLSRDRAYIDSLQQKIDENNTELTAWGSINARLLTMQNYATILSQPSTFQAKSASSSDEDIISTNVTGAAQVGVYPLRVYSLSQTHQLVSRGFYDSQSTVASAGDSIRIETGGGWVDKKTPLAFINGQNGIKGGSIKITDRSGNSATIDLTGALTIQDVIDAINNNSTISVSAEIDYDSGYNVGDAIKLTDTSGGTGNFIVDEVNGGTTAQDLGIYTGSGGVASSVIHGSDINYITWSTRLDLLNDGTGVDEGSIQITDRAGNTDVIDLSSATTLQDVKDLIEAGPNTNVEVQINSDGGGITIHDLNATPTQNLIVDEVNGGTTAQDLGIYTGSGGVAGDKVGDRVIPYLNTVLLRTLNGGSGISCVSGDDFQITQRDGVSFNVDISSAQTLQEVINLINDATGNTAINASYDREGNGILLTDTSGGTGNLVVTSLNGSLAASDLGILKSVASDTLEGDDLNPQYIARCTRLETLNGGEGVDSGRIRITDRSGESAEVDLSNAETIGDVIDAINSASGIDVTASINSQGNGILITDNTGQSQSPLKVEEVGGTTARDLNILQSTTSNVIDGSFEITVSLNSEDTTLEGIRDAINNSDAEVYASIINDGTGVNPYRLVITSKLGGEKGRVIIDPDFSGGDTLEFTTTVTPQDAVVVLGEGGGNSVLITDNSNQLDQAIPGVTLNLLSTCPDQDVYIRVEADVEGIKQSIINLIDAYNDLMDAINTQQSYDADTKQEGGPLFGNINLTSIRNELVKQFTDPVEGAASLNSIFEIGITADTTGHLNVNESELTDILNNNLDGVKDLFSLSQNVALSSFGTTASASSTYSTNYNVESVNNGDTSSDNWGSPGGGWNDGTQSDFPDYLTLTFDSIRTIKKVIIYTLNSTTYPASSYGIKDYELQYLTQGGDPDDDNDWQTYTTVTGNTDGTITHYLPSISTQAIRLKINDSNDGKWSRVVEFEAYQASGIGGRLRNYLDYITDATTGLIASIEDGLLSQNEDYQDRIDAQQNLLDMKREALWREFTQMEQYLGMMQAQGGWLSQQISVLTGLAAGQQRR